MIEGAPIGMSFTFHDMYYRSHDSTYGKVSKLAALKASGHLSADLDPDIVRMSFVSLAMTPMLLKTIFENQMERTMDADFLQQLAAFNGHLLAAGLSGAGKTMTGAA